MLPELAAWLESPMSGATAHWISPAMSWHGRIMVLAWGLLVPMAVLMARYFKVMPGQNWPIVRDNRCWWHIHRLCNYGAVAASCLAVWLVWGSAESRWGNALRELHACAGWAVLALASFQVLGGWLRGSKGGPGAPRRAPDGSVLDLHGDHYAMTRRRAIFERVHKTLGHAAWMLSAIALFLGLWLVDAPRWMWLSLGMWWSLLLVLAWALQSRGRCLDTYQAIWGTDPTLPGARVRPIGWGIRREPHRAVADGGGGTS